MYYVCKTISLGPTIYEKNNCIVNTRRKKSYQGSEEKESEVFWSSQFVTNIIDERTYNISFRYETGVVEMRRHCL